jgi:hypothetical protein
MNVVLAESPGGTSDLDAVDTTGSVGAYLTHAAGLVSGAAGAPRPETFVGPSDPAKRQTCARAAELTAFFERDAIPLRARLYGRAMGMTHNRADAEDLL